MEIHDVLNAMQESVERMNTVAALLERTAGWMQQSEVQGGEVQRVTATAESARQTELERKLEVAERQIAELRAQSAQQNERAAAVRKTLPTATTQLLAKQGINMLDTVEAGAVDAALTGLSLEQRIAVKAQLLRAGLLS